MSITTSIALPDAPIRGTARSTANGRRALLFGVILVTSLAFVAIAVIASLQIDSDDRGRSTYADVEPIRGSLWLLHTVAGVTMIVGVCAVALAVWLLVPARGARWATVGGSLIWLGAALHGVGAGSLASAYYFATDPVVLDPATATALVERINDDTLRILVVPASGAVLVTLGSLLLCVALWKARSVPRWVPIVGAVSGLAALLAAPGSAAGPVTETAGAIASIAIGWYVFSPRAES